MNKYVILPKVDSSIVRYYVYLKNKTNLQPSIADFNRFYKAKDFIEELETAEKLCEKYNAGVV